ncbi:unnamed protein product [Meloidogyne enterolobii]|uniref:Uncharacterized protein n=2 Tax=Meloidogyne enterolobii TaxID=390850 RepID=A0ACB0ZKN1_MELEN
MQFSLYQQFLLNRKGSEKAIDAELRISLSFLFSRSKQLETQSVDLFRNSGQNIGEMKRMILGCIGSNAMSFENYFLESLESNSDAMLKSICLLIKNMWIIIQRINKYNLKTSYFEQIIKEIKKIKTKREFKEKIIFEDLLNWEGKECEDKEEQKKTFLEQRVLLQNEHKNFFENNKIILLKIPGIKTRLEELIPNFKLKYFIKNNIFNNNFELNEHFYSIIFGENKNIFLQNILGIKYFICGKNINNEIKNLKEEKESEKNLVNKLEGIWGEIRPKISSKYDSLFEMEVEELEKEEKEILIYLKEEVNKIYFLIKNKKIIEWIDDKDNEEKSFIKFNEWLNDLMFNEFKNLILEKDFGKGYLEGINYRIKNNKSVFGKYLDNRYQFENFWGLDIP